MPRSGPSNSLLRLGIASVAGVMLISYFLRSPSKENSTNPAAAGDELFVYCAAGLKQPLEAIAADYAKDVGGTVKFQFGGSNTLLAQAKIGRNGDLFVMADDAYVQLAQQDELLDEVFPLAKMRAVIAVRKGNPKQIQGLADLLRDDVRVAIVNPEAGAIGKSVKEELTAADKWSGLEEAVKQRGVFKPAVTEVANDVKLGSVDAGIIWDATVAQMPDLVRVETSDIGQTESGVSISVMRSAKSPASAVKFARYVTAQDKGLRVLKAQGYKTVEGDKWSAVPEITLFAGSVNRRAVEPIIKQFEAREGVKVNAVFNGCGILTASMRTMRKDQASGFPDTFMACDVYHLDTVKEWFDDGVEVSQTDIVIAVPKGNPKQLAKLDDLAAPGLRLAIGHPDQCTIGVLTRRLLQDEADLYDRLLKDNVVTQMASSSLLVPAITTGAADAALAYNTDCLAAADKIDVIRIPSPKAKAVQPFAVARHSEHRGLSLRLLNTIRQSRSIYENAGFGWRMDGSNSDTH